MSFPPPTTTNVDPDSRTITYRWSTGQTVEAPGRTGELMVEMTVHHTSRDKQYVADLHTVEVYPNGTRRTYRLADPERTTTNSSVKIRKTDASRYGRKALDGFAAQALVDLDESQDPSVAAFRSLIAALVTGQ